MVNEGEIIIEGEKTNSAYTSPKLIKKENNRKCRIQRVNPLSANLTKWSHAECNSSADADGLTSWRTDTLKHLVQECTNLSVCRQLNKYIWCNNTLVIELLKYLDIVLFLEWDDCIFCWLLPLTFFLLVYIRSKESSLYSSLAIITAWKESVFRVILVCIFPHSDWMKRYSASLCIQPKYGKIRTRITPNTDTFYAVNNRLMRLFG